MARIIVGVMGDSYGHLSQALALTELAPEHEYLFLGGGTVRDVARLGFRFLELPMPSTFYANNGVDVAATLLNAARVLSDGSRVGRRVIEQLARFSPDLAVTAYEYFTPMLARELGIRCVSLDNHHFLNRLRFTMPPGQRISRMCYSLSLNLMFSRADHYFVSSFYGFPPLDSATTDAFPPVLRKDLAGLKPVEGDHVFVYQTSPTFSRLIPLLEKTGKRHVVYGYGEKPARGNIVFKPPARAGLLQDLASCRYVIANGGHNLISEALFLGKPVFSFPIRMAYEQFFNAHRVVSLGYGDFSLDPVPGSTSLACFEEKLAGYRVSIAKGNFCGNAAVAAKLGEMLGAGGLKSGTGATRI